VGVPSGECGNVQTGGWDRVSTISQPGYSTSVALATGPTDEEEPTSILRGQTGVKMVDSARQHHPSATRAYHSASQLHFLSFLQFPSVLRSLLRVLLIPGLDLQRKYSTLKTSHRMGSLEVNAKAADKS